MSTYFAVRSTIDPDQFIVHFQTPAAAFDESKTSPFQVKWARPDLLDFRFILNQNLNNLDSLDPKMDWATKN